MKNDTQGRAAKNFDCLGEVCPIPVLQIRKELPAIRCGAVVVVTTDHSCSAREIRDYCDRVGLRCLEQEVVTGIWRFTVQQ